MKGAATLIEGVVIISITIVSSLIVISFLLSLSKQTTSDTSAYSRQIMSCSQASFYIENVSFDTSGDCTSGTNHTINITLRNNGNTKLFVEGFNIETNNGSIIRFEFNRSIDSGSSVSVSSVSDIPCTDILIQNGTGYVSLVNKIHVASSTCPVYRALDSEYFSILNANPLNW